MSDFAKIVDTYLAAWNEEDADARLKLVAEVFAPDATYTDPLADVAGHDGISALIGAARGQFPGMVFSAGGQADQHHDIARFTWNLGPAGAAEPLVIGFDVVRVNADGRIVTVFGFLDKVPQG
jgi:hypothetical protein